MKESSSSFWPPGLPAGAFLATLLIVPAFVVMMFDASAGAARRDAPGRFAFFHRPLQLRGSSDFFAGRVVVQAMWSQRFAPLPPGDSAKSTGERRDLVAANERPATARSSLLRLRLENRSDQNLEVEIIRVDSALGNFIPRPDQLMLAPGQVANIDSPVTGRKFTADSMPVAVALRLGGTLETKNLILNDHTLAQTGN